MFTTQLAAIVSAVALLGGWGIFKSVQVSREKKKNQALLQKNEQLKAAKSVAETKVKNFEVRKQNEENISSTSRDGVIDRLHTNKDLRD